MTSPAIVVTVNDDANPVEVLTACHIAVTNVVPWEAEATQNDAFATRQDVYYVAATVAGDAHSYQSPRFTPSHDGDWEWDGFVFPSDGAWTLTLWRVGTGALGVDESIATKSVTVAASS